MLPDEDAITEEELDEQVESILNSTPEEKPDSEEEPEGDSEEPENDSDEESDKDSDEESEKDSEDKEEPDKEAQESELTLSQAAAILGVEEDRIDVDDDGTLYFKTKIDGVEGKASLNALIKSHQLEGHLNKQNMEVVEQRKAVEAERQQFQEERQNKLQQLEDTLQLAAAELYGDYQNINWEQLKASDEDRYWKTKNEFQERQQKLQQTYQQIQQTRQEESNKFHAEREQKLQSEASRLRSTIPGWDTEEGYAKGTQQVRQALQDVGFTDEIINAVAEGIAVPPEHASRLFELAHKAAEYDKLQKQKPATQKKIRTAPKVIKPGESKEPEPKNASLKKSVDLVKKTGGEKGLDDYLKATGILK